MINALIRIARRHPVLTIIAFLWFVASIAISTVTLNVVIELARHEQARRVMPNEAR